MNQGIEPATREQVWQEFLKIPEGAIRANPPTLRRQVRGFEQLTDHLGGRREQSNLVPAFMAGKSDLGSGAAGKDIGKAPHPINGDQSIPSRYKNFHLNEPLRHSLVDYEE